MFKIIHHYLFPHQGNNHRSKIIHNSSLLVLIVLLLFSSWFSIIVNKISPEILGISYSISDQELLVLVNEKRIEHGLQPLRLNGKLNSAASQKARHMFDNNYWAHFAPDNTTPWSFIMGSGYNYLHAGENLAKGFTNSRDAVEAWMNSPTHRDNILSAQYEDVGFAVVEGTLQGEETVLIVELFGQERAPLVAQTPSESEIESSIQTLSIEDEAETTQSASVNEVEEVSLLGSIDATDTEVQEESVQQSVYQSNPIFDIISSTKTLTFVITATLLVAFVLDLLVIARRRIPRIVGDNIDHILILSIFIVFIFIYNLGRVV